jgi:hypothetical protein
MSASLLFIQKLKHSSDEFPGYFVASTAPHNVEDDPLDYNDSSDGSVPVLKSPEIYVQEMADHLKKHKGSAEILVTTPKVLLQAGSIG